MKRVIFFCWFSFSTILVFCQVNEIDSLRTVISRGKEDIAEVKALLAASNYFSLKNLDSVVKYAEKGLLLAQKLNFKKGETDFLLFRAATTFDAGSRSQGLEYSFRALAMYEELKNEDGIAANHLWLQGAYREVGDYQNSLSHADKVRKLVEPSNRIGTIFFQGISMTPLILAEIGNTYEVMGVLDSARLFTQAAINKKLNFNGAAWSFPFELFGRILTREGKYDQAMTYYRKAIPLAIQNGNFKDTLDIYNDIAILYKKSGQLDSAVYYAEKIIAQSNLIPQLGIILQATATISEVYKLKGNKDSTLKYIEQSGKLKEQIFSQREQMEFQNQTLNEVLRKQEFIREKLRYQNNIRYLLLLAGLFAVAFIAFYLFRNNQNRKKAFHIMEEQKRQTEHQREKAEQALLQLQSAQAQLIQSEKMASLGELTAGIAHEIQNPLNFVNNFSEVSTELIAEMKDELKKGKINEAIEIADDIDHNLEKINHHGKRADAIVKGMLQHSRTSSGQKELTDINALADEYLRLSYHGLRAKDKNFNATLKTDFDDSIGNVNIIPQDIGRVLLNLFNNAFYTVTEKGKLKTKGYEPTVTVKTKKIGSKMEISVGDNGNGIPASVKEKIFQPFFTTKPTGQGTGLGLSLSYDIIKAHGGELKVETIEGERSTFIVQLPCVIET